MKKYVAILILILLTAGTYVDQFDNSFQLDDHHSITANPWVTRLSSIPRFFLDPSTVSVDPTRRGSRPLTMATFTIDYWIAGKLQPRVFHITSFVLFICLIAGIFLLYDRLFVLDGAGPRGRWCALIAAGIFAIHPVSADTLNYIVQRAEILAALGIVGGFLVYLYSERGRRYHLYLIPALLGGMSKETGYGFAPLLFAYAYLQAEERGKFVDHRALLKALRVAAPALGVLVALALFLVIGAQTAESFEKGGVAGVSPLHYFGTQLFILPDYVRTFFLPIDLSGDTDWSAVSTLLDPRVGLGALCCILLLAIVWSTESLVVQFGILWFFISLIPTSTFISFSEVRNSHRMFLPFIGLTPAVVAGVDRVLRTRLNPRAILSIASLAVITFSHASFERTKVWRTAESFWFDVTQKSPRNGRGHMNYGVALMARGEYPEALGAFLEALKYAPRYEALHSNLGIVYGALNQPDKAREHFETAGRLAPRSASAPFFYGRFFRQNGQFAEAAALFEKSLAINPRNRETTKELILSYWYLNDFEKARAAARKTVEELQVDREFSYYLKSHSFGEADQLLEEAGYSPKRGSDALNLSMRQYGRGQFETCLKVVSAALVHSPDDPHLLNNGAACAIKLSRFAEAETYAQRAVRLRPDVPLFANNLREAQENMAALAER